MLRLASLVRSFSLSVFVSSHHAMPSRHRQTTWRLALVGMPLLCLTLAQSLPGWANERSSDSGDGKEESSQAIVRTFSRQALTQIYFSEGTAVGDLNNDKVQDVVYGPYWFAGPDFKTAKEIFPVVPQPMNGYANHFFAWTQDFNGDGWQDVLTVGFPGTPAFVYENPGADANEHWKKHQVMDWVSNESPQFLDLTGDGLSELVFTRDGMYGYAKPKPNSFDAWDFVPISESVATKTFGHGLGVGDINGDGRNDLITKDGWFEQPERIEAGQRWPFVPFLFAGPGGAEMYAYDVDGDGRNDVITSLHAHEYGLVWWQQLEPVDGQPQFKQQVIMGSVPSQNDFGIYFSELHSVALHDMDGDGLKDIVTGKTYWSHHRQSPGWDAGAVVYWFKLTRTADGVKWIPYLADDTAGIGRQIVVNDIDGNGQMDIVTGGMLGCHVMTQTATPTSEQEYQISQPKPRRGLTEDLSGAEAAAIMTVPQGFQVQLAAAEPDVHQPVAMAFDERGRLWVAEAYTYPIRAKEAQGLDRIIILEDTDQDGKFDKRTQFTEGLNLVSGLEVGFGGVWVGAAPYLMFIPDANADDVPDGEPVVLLDGFGYQDTHETLNTFNWGPDGWLYGCHGVFTHSRVGKPGTPNGERTPMNAAVWRYHPTRHEFEIFAEGTSNPWGVDFNDHGQAFITACVIPHLYHVIQGGRYIRQAGNHFNPHTYDDIKTIADHAHYAGAIQDHAWWGNEPPLKDDTSDAGGGHAHCGAMIYLGDNWPERYRNTIFFNNIHGNRVNADRLVRNGSGYVGKHSDDLLLSNDRWFRGINLRAAHDGTVYLIDWYDRNACHRTNPEIWDRTNGRVYNISYGTPQRSSVNLRAESDAELAEMAWSQNEWYVRMSRRLLQERAATGRIDKTKVRATIDKLLASEDDTRVLRGMWLGHALKLLSNDDLLKLAGHGSAYVQGWSIQLACEQSPLAPAMLGKLKELAHRPSGDPMVRLYVVSALQRLVADDRWEILAGLMSHEADAQDHNLPLMIWYALEPLVAINPDRAIGLATTSKIPVLREYIIRRAAAEPESLNTLITNATKFDVEGQALVLSQIQKSLEGRVNVAMPAAWEQAYPVFTAVESETVRQAAVKLGVLFGDQRVFPSLRETLADAEAPMASRQLALEVLLAGRDAEAAAALYAALGEPELQGPAVRGLAAYPDPQTATQLLNRYGSFSTAVKGDAIATLVSRSSFVRPLLDAIEAKSIPTTDLHAYHVRQIQALGDAELVKRLEATWGMIGRSSENELQAIARYKELLKPDLLQAADKSHGRAVYQKVCASCHQLFGAGEKVGPDLTGSNRANLEYVLENVLAPSAVVGKDYQMTLLQLVDGRVVSGLITQETDSAVTLRTINDTVVVAKDDIEERQLSELSLMPAGLIDNLSIDDFADLVAYLGSPNQVEIRGRKSPIDATGNVPNAYEGEKLKLVEKTSGNATSQDMRGFNGDRWSGHDHLWWTGGKPGDRLSVEIEVAEAATYEVSVSLTKAIDYGIVQMHWDGQKVGDPIDCFHPNQVVNTGMLSLGTHALTAGKHKLTIEIVGANPQAVKQHMVGLDFVLLEKSVTVDGK
ncbi:MAG: c-type cytochrome [Planctomycetaceae bacterium]|nr:c-type cytochrome [Planctomycetaceae bacterium]